MFVRVTKSKRGSKTWRSVQIVESFRRRSDRMPAHRVIASFGDLPELETENLKRAIAASKRGEHVMLPSGTAERDKSHIKRNLAYLDVAVCYRMWQAWELSELIDELYRVGRREVGTGEVVAALTMQRCVAPRSKLEASRWYPRTSLPELQGISPSRFNNSRVHRALDALAEIEQPLQERLARRIEHREGRFVSLFLDCTDTWFVGHGPDLAHRRMTKEGMMRRRIGIALMCNQDGLPLKWKTLPGNHDESTSMMAMVDAVLECGWADRVPLVVDRAMGRGVTVEGLLARDVHFVTAVPSHEIASYSSRIALGAFDGVELDDCDRKDTRALAELDKLALSAGFKKVSPRRYVLDLGVFTKGEDEAPAVASWLAPSRAKGSMLFAQRIQDELRAGASRAELSRRYDCAERSLRRIQELLSLSDELQRRVLDGEADRLTPDVLRKVARLSPDEQQEAFEREMKQAGEGPRLSLTRSMARRLDVPFMAVRGVVVFNPERFIEQRRTANRATTELQQTLEEINRRLRSRRSRRSPEAAASKMYEAIRHRDLMDAYLVEVVAQELDGRSVHQLRLVMNENAWQRRRRVDGLSLIVGHPQLPHDGDDMVALYFAKDQVEKDFQSIKSVIALRPVNHQTDPKVCAHVSLCMLALLIERLLEQRLAAGGAPMTAAAALQQLATCHLNLLDTDVPSYSVTQPDIDQERILAALHHEDLTNDTLAGQNLTPR